MLPIPKACILHSHPALLHVPSPPSHPCFLHCCYCYYFCCHHAPAISGRSELNRALIIFAPLAVMRRLPEGNKPSDLHEWDR
jgi:hypothetical protein